MRSALYLTILFLSSAVILGCAGGMVSSPSQPTQSQAAMPAVVLSASSSSVTAGSAVTLSWSSTAANSISFSPAIAPAGTVLPMSGSATLTPSASTTYVATAIGAGGSAHAQVNITVTAAPPPTPQPQITLTATPSAIEVGASTMLQWSAQNATMVTISGFGQNPTQGSFSVSPSVTQTYTATAWNGSLSQSASVTVTVQQTKSVVAVNMAGPDNYYFTPSPLTDSLSLYGIDPNNGAMHYLAGSQDADLFNGNNSQPLLTSADGRWLFVQETNGPVIKFSLTDPANFEASRTQVDNNTQQLAGADPVRNYLIMTMPPNSGGQGIPTAVSFKIDDDGTLGQWDQQPAPRDAAGAPAVFDSTGKFFLLGSQLYEFSNWAYFNPVTTSSPPPSSRIVIGFDRNNTHLLAHTTTLNSSNYQDQISIYDFDPNSGDLRLNNSSTVIPGRNGDFSLFALNNDMLWVLSDGVMTSYSFNPATGVLTATGQQFNVAEDFQVPFAFDALTNTLVEPAAQANQLNSYTVNGVSGASTGSYGPVQAGTAPWTMAIAHVK